MASERKEQQLDLLEILTKPLGDGVEQVTLHTNAGDIDCRFHLAAGKAAVIWVGGAGGGLEGPAGGLYPRLASKLVKDGIASLRLAYRHPNYLNSCVLDTLLGVVFLEQHGCDHVALVGHSFGGAVVISAGAASSTVTAVATLSSQSSGTEATPQLSPKPLLLIHGTADQVLPDSCSQFIYKRAGPPRELLLYPGCRHGLDECRDQLDQDLLAWLKKMLLDPTV